MRFKTFYLLVGLALPTTLAVAQEAAGTGYVHLSAEVELALARSAGPAEVADEATVWLLQDGEYVVAEEGTNGNHCFVMRSMPQSLEPICYDSEAAATAMQWEFRSFQLRMAGYSSEEIDRLLAGSIASGELPPPTRPAMAYMLSSGQRLFNARTGQGVGNWKPHVMLYLPNLTLEDLGMTGPSGRMFMFNPGTPRALLIIVVPDFVDPEVS